MLTLPLTVLLVAVALSGCLAGEEADVLGTFYPMTFLAGEIGGDEIDVAQIIPEGTEPHEWDPGVRDLTRLGAARLVLAQDPDFETWLDPILGNLEDGAPPVTYTAERLERLPDDHDDEDGHEEDEEEHGEEEEEHEEEGHDDHASEDPHTWLDPVLFAQQAAAARDAMIEAFPEHEETLRQNAEALIERLDGLHHAFEANLAQCETRNIVVQHDAFAYLAERYDFEVHSVTGLSPQAEPSPGAVARAVDTALEHNLSVVFTETLANPSVMDAIAQDASAKGTNVDVEVLSPLERRSSNEISEDRDYIDIMLDNLDALSRAMRCGEA